MALFTRVVRSGSVTAAAEQLGVAKSTVSAQLAALERGVGVPLLVRTPHGVGPPAAGRRLGRHAEPLRGAARA
ncbi:MAG: LysR family transcriptional regulator, partial [Burkholderiales bacterium]